MAVAFVAVQCEICLVVKFITGQGVLFLVVPCIAELYLELCLAGSVVLSNVGCFGWHHLLPCNVGCVGRCHLLLCNVSSIGLCLTALFVTVQYGLFSGGGIYYCAV